MGESIRMWLYSLLISGCICSCILFVHPYSSNKSLIETGCACIMILIFLSPFKNHHIINQMEKEFSSWTAVENYIDDSNAIQRFMEEEFRAYILKEANNNGINIFDVKVNTIQDENGYWIPVTIEYISDTTISEDFKSRIAQELGTKEVRSE